MEAALLRMYDLRADAAERILPTMGN